MLSNVKYLIKIRYNRRKKGQSFFALFIINYMILICISLLLSKKYESFQPLDLLEQLWSIFVRLSVHHWTSEAWHKQKPGR